MNRDSWKKLPQDIQKIMEDLRIEQSEWTGNYMDNHVKEAMDWSVKTQGVEVIKLSSAEKAKWDAKLQTLTDKWIARAKGKGLPADAIVGDMKMLIKKHSK
jgi:TRAP-type C4-dicarboxylate transport system substrate-binding protein